MIVESESFFCTLIIDDDIPKSGIRLKDRRQFKTEFAFIHARLCKPITLDNFLSRWTTDQLTIIQGRERITFRYAGDLPVLVVGGDDDVICLVQDIQITVELVDVIYPIDL